MLVRGLALDKEDKRLGNSGGRYDSRACKRMGVCDK